MKLEESIYPYFPEAEELPFCLTGIGGSEYQGHILRPEGYHKHQILYCAGGRGVLKTDIFSSEISAGKCFYLPKNIPHEYYPVSEIWYIRWITFDGRGCDDILSRLDMDKPAVVDISDDTDMEDIFDKMICSQREDILYCGYTCSGLVYQYILAFHRQMNAEVGSARSRKLSTLLPALRYIYDHFGEDIPMTFLAELIGVTPQHFCRLFREALGMRPTDYLLSRRLEEAARLIRETDLPLYEIAAKCGFGDPSYFSTVFRKHEGISPAAYRKSVTNTNP